MKRALVILFLLVAGAHGSISPPLAFWLQRRAALCVPGVAAAPTFGAWEEGYNIYVTLPSMPACGTAMQMQYTHTDGSDGNTWDTAPWDGSDTPDAVVFVDNRIAGDTMKFRVVVTGTGGTTIGTASAETTPP